MHRSFDIRVVLSSELAHLFQVSRDPFFTVLSLSALLILCTLLIKAALFKYSNITSTLSSNQPSKSTSDPTHSAGNSPDSPDSTGTRTSSVATHDAAPRTTLSMAFNNMFPSSIVARLGLVPRSAPIITTVSGLSPQTDHSVEESVKLDIPETPWPVKQPYDAFLVLDVEATCLEGTDFNWPNEIIEWPVCLLRWRHKDKEGRAKELYVADEFRSFVKPIWRPELSAFCTGLTGITQSDVDRAPKFTNVLKYFKEFLAKNGLIDLSTGERLERFTWCTDGPFDIRDFVVKQCFISKIQMPEWLRGDVLDVRRVVTACLDMQEGVPSRVPYQKRNALKTGMTAPRRRSLNISQQLRALCLPAFVGRQHCGIDDTRNIARIVIELAKRGIRLEPNTAIYLGRRWQWMGKPGQILEEYCFV